MLVSIDFGDALLKKNQMRGLTINYYLKTFVYFKMCYNISTAKELLMTQLAGASFYESSRKVGLLALF